MKMKVKNQTLSYFMYHVLDQDEDDTILVDNGLNSKQKIVGKPHWNQGGYKVLRQGEVVGFKEMDDIC